MKNEYVFMRTANTSRGGLYTDVSIMSKEGFLRDVERYLANRKSYFIQPTYRFARIDGGGATNFKSMTVAEFEEIFDETDIQRMGALLEYGGGSYNGNYPVFLKAVYVKFGYEKGPK